MGQKTAFVAKAFSPAEAVAPKGKGCTLPDEGWGRLTVLESLPVAMKKWTDSGNRRGKR